MYLLLPQPVNYHRNRSEIMSFPDTIEQAAERALERIERGAA